MIKHVFLDVGGVLVHPHGLEEAKEALKQEGVDLELFVNLRRKYERELSLGEKQFEEIVKEYNEESDSDFTVHEIQTIIFNNIEFNTHLIAFCRDQDFKTSIMSDNWHANKEFLNQYLSLEEWTEEQIYSYEHGLVKTDDEFFEIALDKVGEDAEDCLLIDDKEENVEAARKHGLKAMQFENNQQLFSHLKKLF